MLQFLGMMGAGNDDAGEEEASEGEPVEEVTEPAAE